MAETPRNLLRVSAHAAKDPTIRLMVVDINPTKQLVRNASGKFVE